MGTLDEGFATLGLQGLSCHYLSVSSVLNCNPNVRSGPSGKNSEDFPVLQFRALDPQAGWCDARFTYNTVEE